MILRLLITVTLAFGIYQLYQSPQYRSQLEAIWQELISKVGQLEEQINSQVGVRVGEFVQDKNVEVVVPKSQSLDWGKVGEAGKEILGGERPVVKVEIDYTANSQPTAEDQSVFKEILARYSGKGASVVLDNGNLKIQENYTLQEIVDITKSNRSCYTSSREVCLYVLYLPGKFEGSSALGASFTSTSAAFLAEQMSRGVSPFISRGRIARATITHELGHLFGLVNLVYKSPRDHEDPDQPGHSKNSGSVMYWAVEDLSLFSLFSGGPPVNFDSDDEADLAQIKSGI